MSASALAAKIAGHIRAEGPISVGAYMAMALHDPAHGYYARHEPIGRSGDFVTAPEISQIFGELIGLWCADLWLRMGSPDPVILVELGPGRGALLGDFLRAAESVPDFRAALRLYLVEASPVLRAAQRQALVAAQPRFVDGIDAVPEGPLLLVANEFLDALPVRQLIRGPVDWAELHVALDAENRLTLAAGAATPMVTALVPPELRDSPPGTVVEVCPAAAAWVGAVAERVARRQGAGLFVDYGYYPRKSGATLTALRRHRPVELFDDPGTADLSAHVDFAAVMEAAWAAGAAIHGPVPQGRFLTALGAEARLAALCRRALPPQRARLESGLSRLIDPAGMGTLFKALALVSPGLPAPAGF